MSCCKDCGREIDWIHTADERYIPVDPEPVFVIKGEGQNRFYSEEGEELIGRIARWPEVQTKEAKINTPVGFVAHWWTCPCGTGGKRK